MPSDKKLSEFPDIPSNAQFNSNKKIASETKRFSPSAMVTLYEIDAEDILIDKNISYDLENREDAVFRFHNNLKLLNQDIFWKGQIYRALPIQVKGFETSTRGALPTPKMSIFFDDKYLDFISYFRLQLRMADDLIGAKVTRVRTFAKYLDEENFFIRTFNGIKKPRGDIDLILPEDFEPDPNAEFPREIYYIERKSSENSQGIEFELSSIVDFENIKLPRRLVLSKTCNFTYRGEGCLYESYLQYYPSTDRDKLTEAFGSDNIKQLNLPTEAFPVATENDETIITLMPFYKASDAQNKWNPKGTYNANEIVFTEKVGIKNYYVARETVPAGTKLENKRYWIADKCSKTTKGCKLRWSDNERNSNNVYGAGISVSSVSRASRSDSALISVVGNGNTHGGGLPFGGFPGAEDRR